MKTQRLFYVLAFAASFFATTAFASNYSMSLTVNNNPYKDGDNVEVFQNGGQSISWDSDAQVCFVSSKNASVLVPKNPDGTPRMSPKKGSTSARFPKEGDASITIKCNNQYDLNKDAEEEFSYTRTIRFVVKASSTTPLVKNEAAPQPQPKVEVKEEVIKKEAKSVTIQTVVIKPENKKQDAVKQVASAQKPIVSLEKEQEAVPSLEENYIVQKTEYKGFLGWLRSFFFRNN